MEILGVDLGAIDWRAWLEGAREFALPRALESLGFVLLAAFLFWTARLALRRTEAWLVTRTETEFDDLIARLIRRLVLLSIGFWLLWRLAQVWDLPRVTRAIAATWIVGLTLPIGSFVGEVLRVVEARVVPRTRTRLDDTALPLLNRVARFLVVAGGVLIALEYLGIDITPLLAGAGVAGLALSLAARDTLSNLIAGVLLILDRPFQVGDRIELWTVPEGTGTWGDVIEIGLRATTIRNPDNLVMVIPNNEIMKRDIVNYTASGPDIRLRIPIGIGYDADARKAKGLVLRVAGEVPGVKAVPEPAVIVRGFGDSAVNLELRVWIEDARQRRNIADEITGRVKDLFDAEGIEIPFPKRDLYIRSAPVAAGGPESRYGGRDAGS